MALIGWWTQLLQFHLCELAKPRRRSAEGRRLPQASVDGSMAEIGARFISSQTSNVQMGFVWSFDTTSRQQAFS